LLREQWPAYNKRAAQHRQALANRVQLAQLAARVAIERARRPASSPVSPAPAPEGTVRATQVAELAVVAGELPIPDYESLAAIHVVDRLSTLRPDELEQVRAFEQGNRARRTVLAKVEQLQAAT
jgi:hypothetical protein